MVAILCRTSGNMCKPLLFAFLWKETDRDKSSKDFGMLLFSLLQWLARQDIKPSAFWMAGWAIFQTEAFNILQPTQILSLDDGQLDLDCFTICYGLKVLVHQAQMTKHLNIVCMYLNEVNFIWLFQHSAKGRSSFAPNYRVKHVLSSSKPRRMLNLYVVTKKNTKIRLFFSLC